MLDWLEATMHDDIMKSPIQFPQAQFPETNKLEKMLSKIPYTDILEEGLRYDPATFAKWESSSPLQRKQIKTLTLQWMKIRKKYTDPTQSLI